MRWQGASRRKMTGGKNIAARSKRKFEIGREFSETKIGPAKRKNIQTRGGNRKIRVLSEQYINVTDQSTGKTQRTKAINVRDNRANKHYVRRNILTKGSVVQTDAGLVRITSRPGQDGVINGILMENE